MKCCECSCCVDYEIKRQTELLERGQDVAEETRSFDVKKGLVTIVMSFMKWTSHHMDNILVCVYMHVQYREYCVCSIE